MLSKQLESAFVTNTATTIFEVFDVFSRVALRYRDAHKALPVLIIDNANRLPQLLLTQFQDFAKEASDEGIATVTFVSSEGRIPRRMRVKGTQGLRDWRYLCHALLNEANGQLEATRILPGYEFYKQGGAIISAFLKENTIPSYTYWAIVGDNTIAEKML
ncbi:hypothetical protein GP486_002726 [Trichoglossum hirsutum]|uniref:Uncharacterized protein n=1 Tax=Trichoglossum hirsutum TaxID=265104 RepID=A0A9P8RRF7_9PEZI|nr:hypothetical protein GP486_002726 [Trichoglossum hirsutum]